MVDMTDRRDEERERTRRQQEDDLRRQEDSEQRSDQLRETISEAGEVLAPATASR